MQTECLDPWEKQPSVRMEEEVFSQPVMWGLDVEDERAAELHKKKIIHKQKACRKAGSIWKL